MQQSLKKRAEEPGVRGGRRRGASIAEQSYQTLLGMILSRELAPGQVLEERRLAEALNVSRTPLRTALSRLLGERMLTRLSNGLLAVREIGVQEYLEMVHLRRVLEGEAAALAAGNVPKAELDRLRQRIRRMTTRAKLVSKDHWAIDDELHELVARASGNGLLAAMIMDVRRKVRMCNVERMPGRFAAACREHLALLDALEAGDGERARAAMADHIDNVRRGFLSLLSHSPRPAQPARPAADVVRA